MIPLEQQFRQRLQSGLSRKAVTTADRWACKYRFMGHPYPGIWTFDNHPWLLEMHRAEPELLVGQKSAQVGYTEFALNKAFHYLDVKKMDVLYVLPNTRPDAADFSSGRFDKALELSEHLKAMFSDTQNVGHKRSGSTNLYIRGSNSRSGLMSIPVSLLVLDELDEMDEKNIPLALKRLSGQIERQTLMISTPTIHDFGINFYFNQTTQESFFFRCPSCSRMITLTHDNLVVIGETVHDPRLHESHIRCGECKAKLPHEGKRMMFQKHEWVPKYRDRKDRGFHVNQLYATHLPAEVVAKDFLAGTKDIAAEQTYWNADMGMPHIPDGSQITEEMFNKCISGAYRKLDFNRQGLVTMGVDVGQKRNHFEIDDWAVDGRSGYDVNSYAHCRVLCEGTVREFEELDELMFSFAVHFCVVDCQPEWRKALEFANRFPGRVKLCRYPVGVNGRNLSQAAEEEHLVNVNRTAWLDMSLGRFKYGTIELPSNVSQEYKEHILAQVRVVSKDNDGNNVAKYVTPGNRHDHFGHARNYAEIALPFAGGLGTTQDIRT